MSAELEREFVGSFMTPIGDPEPVRDLTPEEVDDFVRRRDELGYRQFGEAFNVINHGRSLSVRGLTRSMGYDDAMLLRMGVWAGPNVRHDTETDSHRQVAGVMLYRRHDEQQ